MQSAVLQTENSSPSLPMTVAANRLLPTTPVHGACNARARGSCQGLDVSCLIRRALMRNCVTRATPAMATTTPPATAAINRAIPRGMVPDMPRNRTLTFVEF